MLNLKTLLVTSMSFPRTFIFSIGLLALASLFHRSCIPCLYLHVCILSYSIPSFRLRRFGCHGFLGFSVFMFSSFFGLRKRWSHNETVNHVNSFAESFKSHTKLHSYLINNSFRKSCLFRFMRVHPM